MSSKRRDAAAQSLIQSDAPAAERCQCVPLSSLQTVPSQEREEEGVDCGKVTPATQALNANIRAQLSTYFPRATPLSLLLLHISQLEHVHINPQSAILRKRQRYHAPASFLEQVLVNARRSIRSSDQLLIHQGTGAAIIFPEVDQQGVSNILERIYRDVSLLQAETVIPPLRRETEIVMGISSYPEPGTSLEHLLYQVGVTVRKFTLRPAIATQLWSAKPLHVMPEEIMDQRLQDNQDAAKPMQVPPNIPFMQLPMQLPSRLKQLIPHHIACELHCAPMGRDHHCLTVAMADPTNNAAIHSLGEVTGLTIFPVSCEISALDTLLANKW